MRGYLVSGIIALLVVGSLVLGGCYGSAGLPSLDGTEWWINQEYTLSNTPEDNILVNYCHLRFGTVSPDGVGVAAADSAWVHIDINPGDGGYQCWEGNGTYTEDGDGVHVSAGLSIVPRNVAAADSGHAHGSGAPGPSATRPPVSTAQGSSFSVTLDLTRGGDTLEGDMNVHYSLYDYTTSGVVFNDYYDD